MALRCKPFAGLAMKRARVPDRPQERGRRQASGSGAGPPPASQPRLRRPAAAKSQAMVEGSEDLVSRLRATVEAGLKVALAKALPARRVGDSGWRMAGRRPTLPM